MHKLSKNGFLTSTAPGGISGMSHRPHCRKTRSATRSADCSRGISQSYSRKHEAVRGPASGSDNPLNDMKANVAIYTRVQASVPETMVDQLRLCQEHVTTEKLNVVCAYHDVGSANAEMSLRPGLRALLKDAENRKFDAVLVTDLDRLSRDDVNLAVIEKKLQSFGIAVLTVFRQEKCAPGTFIHDMFNEYFNRLILMKIAKRLNREVVGE